MPAPRSSTTDHRSRTPRPCRRTRAACPARPAGEYVELEEARAPDRSPGRPRARRRASRLHLRARRARCTVTPVPRSTLRASAANVGRRLLLRRQVDHVARPRHRAADAPRRARPPTSPRAPPAPTITTLASLVGVAFALGTRGTGTRRARGPRRVPARPRRRSSPGVASSSVVATDAPCSPRARSRRAARRTPSSVSSAGSPRPTSTAALASQRAGGRDGERLPELALEAGFVEERGERAAEGGVDGRRRRDRGRRPSRHATTSRSAATRSAAVVTVENVNDTGLVALSARFFRRVFGGCSVCSGIGADGTEVPLLPAGERVDEIGEAVEVGHDLSSRRASRRARRRRPGARRGARPYGRHRARRRRGSRPAARTRSARS